MRTILVGLLFPILLTPAFAAPNEIPKNIADSVGGALS